MKNKFPDDFLWGAATSSHQVEGDNTLNDWWEWEQAGNTEPSGKACDHYNRFKEDFRIAKDLGHNAHRLSLEWSRLEKEEGVWDASEWDHYKAIIDELKSLEIEPILTLNHFTLPSWLSHKGGWQNKDIIRLFSRFAIKAVKELGEKVQYWIPINEPYIAAFLSYFKGEWPPCEKNFDSALLAAKNMLEAHVEAYSLMHEAARSSSSIMKPKIGVAKAVTAFHPCSKYSLSDRVVTHLRNMFYNHSFIDSALKGKTDLFPFVKGKELPSSKALDFIGLNYYFRQFVHHEKPFKKHPIGEICDYGHHNIGKINNMGWEMYPRGLYEVVRSFSRYRLPIMITENGTSVDDDNMRKNFIKGHLTQLLKAINEGSPVIGYLHWSLMDNFEWAHGYKQKFGLVEVDFNTQKRTVRESARYYSSIITSGTI